MAQNAEKLAARPDRPLTKEVARLAKRHLDKIVEIVQSGDRFAKDNVHEMRVATRRFREVVRVQLDANDSRKLKRIYRFARDLGRQLGVVRGLDVLLDGLSEPAGLRTIRLANQMRRRQEVDKLKQMTEGKPFRAWANDAKNLFEEKPKKNKTAHEVADDQLDKVLEVLNKHKEIKPDDDFAKLHRLRIDAKHTRYRLEFFNFSPLQEFDHAIDLLTNLQDHLGALHDDIILRQELKNALESGIEWTKAEQADLKAATQRLDQRIQQGRKAAKDKWRPVFELGAVRS